MISLLFTLIMAVAQAEGPEPLTLPYSRNPFFSTEGFALGYIVDFDRDGIVFRSYEGTMMLGYLSSENQTVGNPWHFSTSRYPIYEDFREKKHRSQLALVHYWTPMISFQYIFTETKSLVLGIYPVGQEYTPDPSYFDIAKTDIVAKVSPDVKDGFKSGRIVRISLEGCFRKSFEVLVQLGQGGNDFMRLSVSNQQMADFILKAMQSGKIVDINYIGLIDEELEVLRIDSAYQTPFRITRVSVQQ